MNKIKKFIQDNKEEMKVVAYGTVMLAFGFYFGKKFEGDIMDKGLLNLGDTGKTLKKLVGNDLYTLSVIKTQIDKD